MNVGDKVVLIMHPHECGRTSNPTCALGQTCTVERYEGTSNHIRLRMRTCCDSSLCDWMHENCVVPWPQHI